ncbi:hypothetical protein [Mycobacterium sp. TY814]|uniref:hypothetical protein n=1 Tax=unclassified Mycobacterium TaxID=2642494 RepID=UPI002740A524|nr:hypothetical protein [Mycobacterium sp. TY814]MDP7724392.1 hypothetical protein [Mycobacterium sp. TY814]
MMTPAQRRVWRTDVFGHPDLSPAVKLVLLALETYADYPAGTNARPGVKNLTEMCGLKTRIVEEALALGRQLKLIDQTSRANPKAGLAACYCLLSTRATVQVETDSTRATVRVDTPTNTDFNPHESAFLPARNELSTRTTVQPTNPEHQSSNTNGLSPQPGTSPGLRGQSTDKTTESADRQPANRKPPSWIRGPFGPRCRAHGHHKVAPADCERCRDAGVAAKESA